MLKVQKELLTQIKLQVKTVFVSKDVKLAADEVLVVGDGEIDPLVFMRPGSNVGKNLRLTRAPLAPEEHACVIALEAFVGGAA